MSVQVFLLKIVNSIKEESWRIEKWVWGYKKWMIKNKSQHQKGM